MTFRLGGEGQAAPRTGIFCPARHLASPTVDIILYLHGYKYRARGGGLQFDPAMTIDQYWDPATSPRVPLREGLADSGKRAILVAPTLGARAETGTLVGPGGLDAYLAAVLRFLGGLPAWRGAGAPGLGSLILAGHSGAGFPMLRIALGRDRALANLRECWGFDCFYGWATDEEGWVRWGRANPDKALHAYYATGSPTQTALRIARHRLPNLFMIRSPTSHFGAVTANWKARIAATAFLRAAAGPSEGAFT